MYHSPDGRLEKRQRYQICHQLTLYVEIELKKYNI